MSKDKVTTGGTHDLPDFTLPGDAAGGVSPPAQDALRAAAAEFARACATLERGIGDADEAARRLVSGAEAVEKIAGLLTQISAQFTRQTPAARVAEGTRRGFVAQAIGGLLLAAPEQRAALLAQLATKLLTV